MGCLLILLFPFVELALLVELGQRGGRILLFYLLATFLAGAFILRRSKSLSPRWAAGILLLLPGVLSDVLAVLVAIPATRRLLLDGLLRGGRFRVNVRGFHFPAAGYEETTPRPEDAAAPIRDAEFRILPAEKSGENGRDDQGT